VRAVHLRLVLVLDAVALGAAAGALVVGLGLPLAARGGLDPGRVVAVAVAVGAAVAVAGAALLLRQVGRPVDRVLAAADALGATAGDLPILGFPGDGTGRGLSGAAVAFERLAGALAAERARLAEKVTELERANEALVRARETLVRAERLATAGRLASGIAHEVGNPLGAITGYAELARDRLAAGGDAGRAEADDFLGRIAAEAQRIDRIVRDLLDLARPAEPAEGAVDLAAPIDAALRLARVQPRFKGVEVEVALPPGLPAVAADERRLAQVFLNLLLNAGDAMRGAGRVRVEGRADGASVVIAVLDSGPGIPPDHLPRVFEPFFTTKGGGEGTGLGLAISQGIVEALGGELTADNAEGGGAVFRVRLRAADGQDMRPRERTAMPPTP
jgi:two-component system, NtrC family, sensor kinase